MPCFFNHPRQIVCRTIIQTCRNEVTNPVVTGGYGYFNNLDVGAIAPGGILPVTAVTTRGNNIVQSTTTTGAVSLAAGTYQISYSVTGEIPTGGTISAGLLLNGVGVSGTDVTESGTAGNVVGLNRTIILNVPNASTLNLTNTGTEETTYNFAGITITQL